MSDRPKTPRRGNAALMRPTPKRAPPRRAAKEFLVSSGLQIDEHLVDGPDTAEQDDD